MKVPLSWLKEFVDVTSSLEELAHLEALARKPAGGPPCNVMGLGV